MALASGLLESLDEFIGLVVSRRFDHVVVRVEVRDALLVDGLIINEPLGEATVKHSYFDAFSADPLFMEVVLSQVEEVVERIAWLGLSLVNL